MRTIWTRIATIVMTPPTRADLIESARRDAEAFRTHPIYDSEGDGRLLTVVADRIDSYAAALTADAERIAALKGEVERLRAKLHTAKEPHWFYLGDDCSSERCRYGIDECINDDFEGGNEAKGDHVLQISGAPARCQICGSRSTTSPTPRGTRGRTMRHTPTRSTRPQKKPAQP